MGARPSRRLGHQEIGPVRRRRRGGRQSRRRPRLDGARSAGAAARRTDSSCRRCSTPAWRPARSVRPRPARSAASGPMAGISISARPTRLGILMRRRSARRASRGLRRRCILTAEDDLMRDENLAYARRLRESGVRVREHVLAAPTQWPCALSRPVTAERAWAAAVRHHFSVFFAETVASRTSQSSFQSSSRLKHRGVRP